MTSNDLGGLRQADREEAVIALKSALKDADDQRDIFGTIGVRQADTSWAFAEGESANSLRLTVTLDEGAGLIRAKRGNVAPSAGRQVVIRERGNEYVIDRPRDGASASGGATSTSQAVAPHLHNPGNSNYFPLDPAATFDGFVQATGNGWQIAVYRTTYVDINGNVSIFTGGTLDLAAAASGLAANQTRWVILYINKTMGSLGFYSAPTETPPLNADTHLDAAIADCLENTPFADPFAAVKINAGAAFPLGYRSLASTDGAVDFTVKDFLRLSRARIAYQRAWVDSVAQNPRGGLNLVAGANVTLTPTDDSANNRTSVEIAATSSTSLTVQKQSGTSVGSVDTITFDGNALVFDETGGEVRVQVNGISGIDVREDDGTPDLSNITALNLIGIVLTDDGGGQATLEVTGTPASSITVEKEGGSPSVANVTRVVFGDNLTVTDNGSGEALVDASGGGGGGSATSEYWEPRVAPASPHADDEEMVAKPAGPTWTESIGTGIVGANIVNQALEVELDLNWTGASTGYGLTRALPSFTGDWMATTRVGWSGTDEITYAGFFAEDSGGTRKGLLFGNRTGDLEVRTVDVNSDFNTSGWVTRAEFTPGAGAVYLRMAHDDSANILYWAWSLDGINWSVFPTDTLIPTDFGLFVSAATSFNGNAFYPTRTRFDFLRWVDLSSGGDVTDANGGRMVTANSV